MRVPGLLEAALWLEELRGEGKIDLLGGTNFDTPHTAALVAAGVPLASMQVQYSLLDARPEHGLVDVCRRQRHSPSLLRHGRRRLPERCAGSAGRSRSRPSRTAR